MPEPQFGSDARPRDVLVGVGCWLADELGDGWTFLRSRATLKRRIGVYTHEIWLQGSSWNRTGELIKVGAHARASSKWILDHYRHPVPSEALVDGTLVRRVPVHNIDRLGGTWSQTDTFIVADTGEELTMFHRFAIIPLEEVMSSIREAGFDCVDWYSSWASNAPDGPEGPRVIAVGRRSPMGT
jgi:hypothetical protein